MMESNESLNENSNEDKLEDELKIRAVELTFKNTENFIPVEGEKNHFLAVATTRSGKQILSTDLQIRK